MSGGGRGGADQVVSRLGDLKDQASWNHTPFWGPWPRRRLGTSSVCVCVVDKKCVHVLGEAIKRSKMW